MSALFRTILILSSCPCSPWTSEITIFFHLLSATFFIPRLTVWTRQICQACAHQRVRESWKLGTCWKDHSLLRKSQEFSQHWFLSKLCAPVHSLCKPPQHFNEVVTTVCKQLAHEKQRILVRVNSWKKLSYFCLFLFQIGTLCWQGKASQTCVLHIAGVNKQTACFHTNYLLMKDRTLYTGQDVKETLEKKLWT